MTQFTASDFRKARMYNWLMGRGGKMDHTLNFEKAPSPDGTIDGQITWYDYYGKTTNCNVGTNYWPSLIARVVPDGSTQFTWYRYDAWGQPTNIVTTYSSGYGANVLYRTNVYVYDHNDIDLKAEYGPKGELLGGYAYVNHWMSRFTNAVGDVTAYYYDSHMRYKGLTNVFTAVAMDSIGRASTYSVNTYLPTPVQYVYGSDGNLLSDGTRQFTYDGESQLVSVYVTNSWQTKFAYDGKYGRRLRKEFSWVAGAWLLTNEVHYVYDHNLVIQERDRNNLPITTYTRGVDLGGALGGAGGIGGLLAMSQPSAGNVQHYYYHSDGAGNITAMLNADQRLVAQYLYDPFGNALAAKGYMANQNHYRFSSKEWDNASGFLYYGYRYYDPNGQRWLNRDPVMEEGGVNLYAYVGNNPVNWVDPVGLWQITVFGGSGIGAYFSIGWNQGHINWSLGIGAGMGSSISIDPANAAPNPGHGFSGSLRMGASVGAGVVGASCEGGGHFGGSNEGYYGNANVRLGYSSFGGSGGPQVHNNDTPPTPYGGGSPGFSNMGGAGFIGFTLDYDNSLTPTPQ